MEKLEPATEPKFANIYNVSMTVGSSAAQFSSIYRKKTKQFSANVARS